MRGRRFECNCDPGLAPDAIADAHDATLLLGLRAGMNEKQALALEDGCLEFNHAALVMGIDRLGVFVKRLPIRVGSVDQ